MQNVYFKIKDDCRKLLTKHLLKALSAIPPLQNPSILDVGCGTGVPGLTLNEIYMGSLTCIDIDKESLDWLKDKINSQNWSKKTDIIHSSFLDTFFETNFFDLILAEGVLHIIGFEKGFRKLIPSLKKDGYFVIHDENKDHHYKTTFIEEQNCKLLTTLNLDEKIWWNDYYQCLEKAIDAVESKELLQCFESDIQEMEMFKKDPTPFRSIYYVIQKR